MKKDKIWLEVKEWELVFSGWNSFVDISGGDPDLEERQREFEMKHPPEYWYSSSVVGVGMAAAILEGTRRELSDVHFKFAFIPDSVQKEDLEFVVGAEMRPFFGRFVEEIRDLSISCPFSEREWLVATLRENRNPIILAELRTISTDSDTRVIDSFRVLSDKRAIIREERRV